MPMMAMTRISSTKVKPLDDVGRLYMACNNALVVKDSMEFKRKRPDNGWGIVEAFGMRVIALIYKDYEQTSAPAVAEPIVPLPVTGGAALVPVVAGR